LGSDEPLIVLNPAAGFGQRGPDPDKLRRALRRAGLPDRWVETTQDCDADELIRRSPGRGPVIVMGGDGTVQAAARALAGGDRPMVIVPVGSGNVVALRLALPFQVDAALSAVKDGVVRRVDLGLCRDQPFLLAMGIGMDGRLMRQADRQAKNKLGKLAYLWFALRNFPSRHHRFELTIDGKRESANVASVVIANFGTQVGPWVFPPDAQGEDGQLDVALIRMASLRHVIGVVTSPLRPGRKRHPGVRLFRASTVSVRCERPLPLQLDGEDLGDHTEFDVTIQHGALPLLVTRRRLALQLPWLGWPKETASPPQPEPAARARREPAAETD
jgi:diacylglycerol kinase (ATP)